MDRIINVKINGSYLTKDNTYAGVQHEGNANRLRIEFDPGWDGFAKTVTFWDARGEHPVKRILTTDLLEDATVSARIYLCPIPPEAMTRAGRMTFIIDGSLGGVRQRSVEDKLKVRPACFAAEAAESTDPTPTQAEQLQTQIEAIKDDVVDAAKAANAKEAAETAQKKAEEARQAIEDMSVTSEQVAYGNPATVEKQVRQDGSVNLHYQIPAGKDGTSVPEGGAAGEILMKTGAEDYAFGWTKDVGGLTVEAEKSYDYNQFAPAESLNGRWSSLVFAKLVVPDGYDRIRLRSGRIPVDGSGTVRFFACTLADDGATGTMTVEALLGSVEAVDGAAVLVTDGRYTADHTVYIAVFADTDMICGVDLTGIGTTVFPQIAEDAGEPDSIGDTIPVSMVCRCLASGALAYDAIRNAKTLKEIQAENNERLTALENMDFPTGGSGDGGGGGVGIKSVEQTTTSTEDGGFNVVTVTLTDGTKSTAYIRNGSKGSPGADGYTPVKGTDYWTAEDKAEMVSEVLAAIPAAEGVAF